MSNLLSNSFKKVSWKTLVDADADFNFINKVMSSYKATQSLGTIDDYAYTNSIMNRVLEDPGPKIALLDTKVFPTNFRNSKAIFDYEVGIRNDVVSNNKIIADAKAACVCMHAKGVVIFDHVFTAESTIDQFKLRLLEETAGDRWLNDTLELDIVGAVPEYLVDTFDIKEWVKSKLRSIDIDNDGVDIWARAYVEDFEWIKYQASPIYHYRELQRVFMIFATGQASMFSTYSTNWNVNTDVGQTVTGWITKENRFLMLLAKSGGTAVD
jgi:hypothetical protein